MKNKEKKKPKKFLRREDLTNLHINRLNKKNLLEMPYFKLREMRNLPNLKPIVMLLWPELFKLRKTLIWLPKRDNVSSMKRRKLKQIL